MDSLLACYGSDGEEEEEPSPAPIISGKPLFASLPPPKTRAAEELVDPLAAGLFRSLPTPNRGNRQNVVEYRPPVNITVPAEDDDEKSKKKTKDQKVEKEQIVLGGLILPPPKNTTFGVALGSGGRRVDAFASVGDSEQQQQQQQQQGWSNPEQGNEPESYDAQYQVPQGHEAQSYGAEYAQTYGAEYAEGYGAEYAQYQGQDPGAAGQSYGAEYAQGYGAEYGQYQAPQEHEPGAAAGQSYGPDYGVPDSSEIYLDSRSYGPREFPEANRGFKQDNRKRKGREEPVKFVEIKQADLTKNRPREDQFRMTGIAFGSPFDKREDEENKPSRLHKRKHQIGSLYYDMRQKEFELMERRARGQLSKSQTMAKYGW